MVSSDFPMTPSPRRNARRRRRSVSREHSNLSSTGWPCGMQVDEEMEDVSIKELGELHRKMVQEATRMALAYGKEYGLLSLSDTEVVLPKKHRFATRTRLTEPNHGANSMPPSPVGMKRRDTSRQQEGPGSGVCRNHCLQDGDLKDALSCAFSVALDATPEVEPHSGILMHGFPLQKAVVRRSTQKNGLSPLSQAPATDQALRDAEVWRTPLSPLSQRIL